MDAKHQDLTNSIGLLIIRVGMGGYMLTHGWGKFNDLLNGNWERVGDPIGIGPAASTLGIVGAEFFCAVLVIIGLGTRVAAAPLVFAMLVAAFVAHGSDPWTIAGGREAGTGSKQLALMYMVPFLALIFTGAGKLSVDGLIWPRFKEWRRKRKKK
jgi:putative oxidoreductase